VREIQEELSFVLNSQDLVFLGDHVHQYPQRKIRIFLWQATIRAKPEFILCDHDQVGWFSLEEIKELNLTAGDKSFISLLK
jgi:hypothetical protein